MSTLTKQTADEKVFSNRDNIVYGTGNYVHKSGNNLGRSYNLDILGDWVRWTREEIIGLTLQEAADRWTDRVGEKMEPKRRLTDSGWRNQYEMLGRETNDGQQKRYNPTSETKCEYIATVLDQPIDVVRMLSGYLPIEAMKRPEVILLSQDMDEDSYKKWIAYGAQLRREFRSYNTK